MNKLYDNHHVFYYRSIYDSMEDTRALRHDPRLIIPMDILAHKALHRDIVCVPPLPTHLAKATKKEFDFYNNGYTDESYLSNVENLQQSIEDAMSYPQVTDLEKRIGSLVIYVVGLQKPYIERGSVPPQVVYHPQSPLNRKW